MNDILNLVRYRELLVKERDLNLNNSSLLIEDKEEFSELLSYPSKLKRSISYQNREEYFALISQYLNSSISIQSFQRKLLELDKKSNEAAKILINDLKDSSTFSVNLIAIQFGSLVYRIVELSDLAQEFGPEDGISDQEFMESVKKIYSEMLDLQNQQK